MSILLPTLRRTPPTLHLLRLPLQSSIQLILPTSLSLPSLSTGPSRLLEGLQDILKEWIQKAVPKSKTTAGGKRMRSSNKGLKEQQNIVACASCGSPKRSHHLCQDCHSGYRREFHQEAKNLAKGLIPA